LLLKRIFTPVFPKVRVGIITASLLDSARQSMGPNIDPIPAAPAAFKKSLRDQLLFLGIIGYSEMQEFSHIYSVTIITLLDVNPPANLSQFSALKIGKNSNGV
jgi:hypothetical protein